MASSGGPPIEGCATLRRGALPPNWRVSGWRRSAQSRHQARSEKLAVRKGPFEFPIHLLIAIEALNDPTPVRWVTSNASRSEMIF